MAKTEAAQAALSKQFQDRAVQKTYLALVHGVVGALSGSDPDRCRVDLPLGPDPTKRLWQRVDLEGGRPAVTDCAVLQRGTCTSLVRCAPKTGRTHQLRVHLKALGHIIVGDSIYGGPPSSSTTQADDSTSRAGAVEEGAKVSALALPGGRPCLTGEGGDDTDNGQDDLDPPPSPSQNSSSGSCRSDGKVEALPGTQPAGSSSVGGQCDGRRLMLHAHVLALTHPATGEALQVTSPCPPGFHAASLAPRPAS